MKRAATMGGVKRKMVGSASTKRLNADHGTTDGARARAGPRTTGLPDRGEVEIRVTSGCSIAVEAGEDPRSH